MKDIIDPVAFKIGPVDVRWYGVIMGTAILIGIFLVLRESKRKGIDQEFFLDFFIYGIPTAIIGARLYYVIFRWQVYKGDFIKIISTRQGGIAIHGALIGGLLVLIYLTKRRRVSFWKAVDILAPAVILGQAIGRWGNFINQEAHGGIVSREFISRFPEFIQRQMFIYGNYYNPTFLYESLWNLLIFIILIILRRKEYIKTGDIFLVYVVGYSTGRFFIEGMRTDSLMLGPVRIAQLVSVILVVTGTFIFIWKHRSLQN